MAHKPQAAFFSNRAAVIDAARDMIDSAVADYIRELPDDKMHPFLARKSRNVEFAGSSSCRLHSSGFHSNHVHDRGWIGSAYCVSLPEVTGTANSRAGWLKFGASDLSLGSADRVTQSIQPKAGRLVLFPSYFWHGTVPFNSDQPRLSIAFDVVPQNSLSRS